MENGHEPRAGVLTNREPTGQSHHVTVPSRRTLHLRFNHFDDPEPIPRDTYYASLLHSDVSIVVKHTRLDSRQAQPVLLSTGAFARDHQVRNLE